MKSICQNKYKYDKFSDSYRDSYRDSYSYSEIKKILEKNIKFAVEMALKENEIK